MKKDFKRILSLLLSAMLIATSIPVTVLGKEVDMEETNIAVGELESKDTLADNYLYEGDSKEDEGIEDGFGFTPFSLLPIEEVKAKIDLQEYFPLKLKAMKVRDVLDHLETLDGTQISITSPTAITVWSDFKDEDGNVLEDVYRVTNMDDTVNMLMNSNGSKYSLQLIIGSGNQLDVDNIRYLVDVYIPEEEEQVDFEVYIQDSELNRTRVKRNQWSYNRKIEDKDIIVNCLEVPLAYYDSASDYYVGLSLLKNHEGVDINIYEGIYSTAEEAYAAAEENPDLDVTDKIYKQDMGTIGAGLKGKYADWNNQKLYTSVIKYNGRIVDTNSFIIYIVSTYSYVYDGELYKQENNEKINITQGRSHDYSDDYDIEIFTYSLRPGYKANDEYYYYMEFYDGEADKYDNSKVTKAVVGHYDSLAKASGQPDIKSQLFTDNINDENTGYKGNFSGEGIDFTIFADEDVWKYTVKIGQGESYVNLGNVCVQVEDGSKKNITDRGDYEYSDDYKIQIITYSLDSGYDADNEYYYSMKFFDGEANDYDNSKVTKAVVGHYDSLAKASGQPDIKSQLFTDNINVKDQGYKANFSGEGVDFTVFYETEAWKFTVKAVETLLADSGDKYFRVNNVKENNKSLDSYVVPYNEDSYYINGYQTLLINDSGADMISLKPVVDIGYNAKVYVDGVMENTKNDMNVELSAQDFTVASKDPNKDPHNSVKYTVSAENWIDHKNYWVTMVKKVEGPHIFVNGPDEREVFLDNFHGNNHDIFIANIGNEELTGINVTLDAANVKLDEYWTIGGNGNNKLAAFTETKANNGTEYGELFNVAKIRLVPDGEGVIDGTLTVSASGQKSRVIKLKGFAGNPKIDTESLHDAVKYVPYSSIITTNNIHDWNKVTFRIEDGELPEGINLLPSGELYGVAKEFCSFPITVCADFSHDAFKDSFAEFTLIVKENTDENVENAIDSGYEIVTRVPDMTSYTDREFKIEGEYGEFIDFWLDGEKLVKNVDYRSEEGSTKITIRSQTFSNAGNGKHTIAAEFRVDGDINKELKRSAQNYNMDRSGSSSGIKDKAVDEFFDVKFITNGGSKIENLSIKKGDKLSDIVNPVREGFTFAGWFKDAELTKTVNMNEPISASLTLYAKWVDNAPVIPDTPPENASGFADIKDDAWYYADVDWAYKNGLIIGINNLLFSPDTPVTQSMILTVLARLSDADLSMYENGGISEEDWYTKYELWGKSIGLLDEIVFNPNMAVSREEMAIILVRYINYAGINYAVTDEYVLFADESFISEYSKDAMQILFKLGIFKGRGNQVIDPASATTRAELTALLHRLVLFMETQN